MKQIYTIIAAIMILAAAAFTESCNYRSINGDIDGQWQLMTIDEPDGTQKSMNSVYYGFGMHVVNLRGPGNTAGNLTYDKKTDKLTINVPREYDCAAWGLPKAPFTVTFDVVKLNSKHLVMKRTDNDAVYTFRKF